ncbi:MAG: 5'-nucleotidase C-terminal domain-containing protein, partial [Rhizobiales bacterium]|nr:5'-nucleotidase C-terminal domain-containing protein [Hyphomicrobiales bacterium]
RVLQVSKGFSYTWDNAKPLGDRIVSNSMILNNVMIDPTTSYRVTVNNFLAVGGDGFTVLKGGTNQLFGLYDVDALYAYFQANSPVAPPTTGRITRLN